MADLRETWARFDQHVERHRLATNTPGIALAITDREKVLHTAVFGHADLAKQIPLTADHLFEIGSVGKSFTAIALLQLVEEGKLDLENRQPDYFYAPHSDFELFLLQFGREEADDSQVVELFYGNDWYVNGRYTGPPSFDIPDDWRAYPGHYRSHNPWYSNFRIVLRKGELWHIWPDGSGSKMVDLGDGRFRFGDSEHSPERLQFDSIVNGKAWRVVWSGNAFYRFFTP